MFWNQRAKGPKNKSKERREQGIACEDEQTKRQQAASSL